MKHLDAVAGRLIRRLFCCLFAIMLASCPAPAVPASPATTTVDDVIYRADGGPAGGTVLISWPALTSADAKPVAAGSLSVPIGPAGHFTVALVPNEGATPTGVYYKVIFQLDDGHTDVEYWSVPTASPAKISAIRSTLVPASVAVQAASRQYVDQAVAARASDASVVHVSGDETVAGTKQFAQSPLVPAPASESSAVNKQYVDSTVTDSYSDYVRKDGDTMVGSLNLANDPSSPDQASNRHYVDQQISNLTSGLSQKLGRQGDSPVSMASVRFASQFPSLQAAVDDAGTTGAVVIPSDYDGADTFTNPNQAPVFDLRRPVDKTSGEFNVRSFGAVGNGVADDTSSIQAAVDAACTAAGPLGRKVFLPSGVYQTTRPIRLHCAKLQFAGASRFSTRLNGNFAGPAVMIAPSLTIYPGVPLGPALIGGGNAMLLDGGLANYLNLGDALALKLDGLTGFTVEAWIKLASTADGMILSSHGLALAHDSPSSVAFDLRLEGGHLRGSMTVNKSAKNLTGSTVVTTNVPHHVALTYDGATVRLFLDGTVQASVAASGSINQQPWEDVAVGPSIDEFPDGSSYNNAISGAVDSIRFSNRGRYTAAFSVPTAKHAYDANTVLLLNFDNQWDLFTAAQTANGATWLAMRHRGGSTFLDRVDVRDMNILSAAGSSIVSFLNISGRYENLVLQAWNYPIYLWNNNYLTHLSDVHTQGGNCRASYVNSSAGGVSLVDHLQIDAGQFGIVVNQGSHTFLTPFVAMTNATLRGALFVGAADMDVTLVDPHFSGENGVPNLVSTLGASVPNLRIYGGTLESDIKPALTVDGGGAYSVYGTTFSAGSSAPSLVKVAANPTEPIVLFQPTVAYGANVPWSDAPSQVTVYAKGKLPDALPAQPTIADFTKAAHTHATAAQGGQLDASSIASASKQGNGSKFLMAQGSFTSGDCLKADINGNAVDGGTCGSGGGGGGSVTSVAASGPPEMNVTVSSPFTTPTIALTWNTPAPTDQATASALVKRDASGNASFATLFANKVQYTGSGQYGAESNGNAAWAAPSAGANSKLGFDSDRKFYACESNGTTCNKQKVLNAGDTLDATKLTGAVPAASIPSIFESQVTNLTSDLAGKANASHQHNGSDINAGTVATARLGSGTADSSKCLKGDSTWGTCSGGGSGTVTSVSASAPADLSVSVANPTSTPAINLSWSTPVPTDQATASALAKRDSSGNLAVNVLTAGSINYSGSGPWGAESPRAAIAAPSAGSKSKLGFDADGKLYVYESNGTTSTKQKVLNAGDSIATGVGSSSSGQVLANNDGSVEGWSKYNSTTDTLSVGTVSAASVNLSSDLSLQNFQAVNAKFGDGISKGQGMYLISGHREESQCLLLFASPDGQHFQPLQGSRPDNCLYTATGGDNGVRDASIMQASWNSRYYIAHTNLWCFNTACSSLTHAANFTILVSDDLLNWTRIASVDLSSIGGTPANYDTWAPEWFLEPGSTDYTGIHVYVPVDTQTGDFTFQLYEVHPTNATLTAWSNPVLVLGSPYAYDPFLFKDTATGTYYLWYKLATGQYADYATSTSPTGPFTVSGKSSNWTGWGQIEALSVVIPDNAGTWRVCYRSIEDGVGIMKCVDSTNKFSSFGTPFTLDGILDARVNHMTVRRFTDLRTQQLASTAIHTTLLPLEQKRGAALCYDFTTGDCFGTEQLGVAQTGDAKAQRDIVSSASGSYRSIGKYTAASTWTEFERYLNGGYRQMKEISTPGGNPPSGSLFGPYAKSGDFLCWKNSAGVESCASAGVTGVSATTPLASTGGLAPTISIQKADATHDGYLSQGDWSTFNGKQSALAKSDATHDGYLSQGDWSTFNGKQAALGFTAENTANKGVANGYASLNASGDVPAAQLGTGTASADAALIGGAWTALPSCSNTNTDKLMYSTTTHTFSCGTDQNTGSGGGADIGTQVVWTDEFFGGNTTSGTIGDMGWTLAGSATVAAGGGENGHPGAYTFQKNATGNGYMYIAGGRMTNLDTAGTWSYKVVFKLLDVTKTSYGIGLNSCTAAGSWTGSLCDAIFAYSSTATTTAANWQCYTEINGGTQTVNNSSPAKTTDTNWHTLSISGSAGTIAFTMDGTQMCSQNTGVPANAVNFAFYVNPGEAVNKGIVLDAVQFKQTVSR